MTPDPVSADAHGDLRPRPGPLRLRARDRAVRRRGRRYLDFLAGIAVVSLGHANPRVAEAIARQAARLVHVSNLFHNELAEPSRSRAGPPHRRRLAAGGQVFFANSGAEANECAIKLARRVGGPGRYVVVSALGSFHGRTLATLAATGQPKKHETVPATPRGFPPRRLRRPRPRSSAPRPGSVAAVLLEPIQGEAGVVVPPDGYLAGGAPLCDERGILLIARRDADRPRTDRPLVRLPARGDPARRRHRREGARQRDADRRLLGYAERSPPPSSRAITGAPSAASRSRARRRWRPWPSSRRIDAPGLASADRLVPCRACSARSPASPRSAARACCSAPCSSPGSTPSRSRPPRCGQGLVVNAAGAGVLRLAPPLTVSIAEVDEAVGILAVGARIGGHR